MKPSRSSSPLSPLEIEVIDFFVQISSVLGQPRSLAEIYGLLFISARPLAMDDLIERLQLSKGSASQGLKFLRNLGAVKMIYVAGDRRVHYEAVAELRNLATRFLRDRISPHLEGSQARLGRIMDNGETTARRGTRARQWARDPAGKLEPARETILADDCKSHGWIKADSGPWTTESGKSVGDGQQNMKPWSNPPILHQTRTQVLPKAPANDQGR